MAGNWYKSKTFAGRLARRIILVMLLTMTFTSGIIFAWAFFSMSVMTTEHYQDVIEFTNERVDKILTSIEVSAANSVVEIEEKLDNPEAVAEVLKQEMEVNSHIFGCGVGFISDFYPQYGRWFEPYAIRRDSSNIEVNNIGSASHDYLNSKWFLDGINNENGFWSDPYFDDAGANAMLCTFTVPIHDSNGRVVGALGADVPLDWLTVQLQEISAQEKQKFIVPDSNDEAYTPYCFIIGRNGDYIVHPEKDRVLNKNYFDYAKETPDTTDEHLGRMMLHGEHGYKILRMESIKSYVFYAPLPRAGWSMAVVVPSDTIHFLGLVVGCILLFLLLIGLLLVFRICRYSIRRATKPLKQLSESARQVALGHFDTQLPDIKHNDEIRHLRDSFGNMQQSLAQYIEQLKTTTAQKASIESELNVAHNIQMAMVPKTFPPYPERTDIDIYASLKSAKAVGGDLYDYQIRDDKLFFCIGDVAGKGVPASLIMTVTNTLFATLSVTETHPEKIVETINDELAARSDSGMFVTLLVGVLDLQTGLLSYCNAGHEAPVIIQQSQSPTFLVCQSNLPAGAMGGMNYTPQQIMLEPGTTIFLYTDGLTEAEKVNHDLFGKQEILRVAEQSLVSDDFCAQKLVEEMEAAVRSFVGDAEQSDDLTMLVFKYK